MQRLSIKPWNRYSGKINWKNNHKRYVSHDTGFVEIQLKVIGDVGTWDAYVDYLRW